MADQEHGYAERKRASPIPWRWLYAGVFLCVSGALGLQAAMPNRHPFPLKPAHPVESIALVTGAMALAVTLVLVGTVECVVEASRTQTFFPWMILGLFGAVFGLMALLGAYLVWGLYIFGGAV